MSRLTQALKLNQTLLGILQGFGYCYIGLPPIIDSSPPDRKRGDIQSKQESTTAEKKDLQNICIECGKSDDSQQNAVRCADSSCWSHIDCLDLNKPSRKYHLDNTNIAWTRYVPYLFEIRAPLWSNWKRTSNPPTRIQGESANQVFENSSNTEERKVNSSGTIMRFSKQMSFHIRSQDRRPLLKYPVQANGISDVQRRPEKRWQQIAYFSSTSIKENSTNKSIQNTSSNSRRDKDRKEWHLVYCSLQTTQTDTLTHR